MNAGETPRVVPILDYASPHARGRLFRVMRRTISFLAWPALGLIAGVLLVWVVGPVQYAAEAMIYVGPPLPPGNTLYTIAAQVTSPTVQNAARASALGSSIPAADWNRAEIASKVDRRTDLVRIISTHPSAARAALIDQAILESSVARIVASGQAVQVVMPPPPAALLQPQRNPILVLGGGMLGAAAALMLTLVLHDRKPRH